MQISINKELPKEFQSAEISFTSNGEPHSIAFDDVYFSDCGGMDETIHVFINGNNIKERLLSCSSSEFTIGETGFGTGLNLLTLMSFYDNLKNELKQAQLTLMSTTNNQNCKDNQDKDATQNISSTNTKATSTHSTTSVFPTTSDTSILSTTESIKLPHINFLTVEKFPVSREDLIKTYTKFPSLAKYTQDIIDKYDNLHGGVNILELNKDFTLYLLIGDIQDCFTAIDINPKVDAWFLDGFAPTQNTDMWSVSSMKNLVALSKIGTTIATFTVAGIVKSNLKEAGFTLKKIKGFGRKREMLTGTIISD